MGLSSILESLNENNNGIFSMKIVDRYKILKKKHPLLLQFVFIIAALYEKMNVCYDKIKAMNNVKLLRKYKHMKVQISKFRYYMDQNKTELQLSQSIDDCCSRDVQNIWELSWHNEYGFANGTRFIPASCNFCDIQQQTDNKAKQFKVCSKCRLSYYCSKKCQKFDWQNHKKVCT